MMNHEIPQNIWDVLKCPHCEESLHRSNQVTSCKGCGSEYRHTASGSLDLRLLHQKTFQYDYKLGPPLTLQPDFSFGVLEKKRNPDVDFSEINIPHHLSKEILSHFPKAKSGNSLMLDLGCGNMIHREVCENAGFKYVGLDYENDSVPILGDAHALPFKDESFEFILSIAVLEHIRYPFVMMREAYRVLKENGVIIGTAAFLEPFHGNSFYHHTHLGIYNTLREGGFNPLYICPSKKWAGLDALASMVLFPMMPKVFSKLIVKPIQIIHRIWWRIGRYISSKASETTRLIKTTGAFTFIARK